ncbi:DUF4105 domain-containing protein [uncultured Bacteroides sp.]|uniref:lipoprotein N-acyltransferase Lnb n=1 Tax=uncultured Bacteroides sp. TaxID=162156 RepID=UPI002AABB7AE|nr:DUF4105 domain-containing protein [uncultured Bacteroides sp.]
MKKILYISIISALFFSTQVLASLKNTNPNDSIDISLLTCSPGDEIYSLFGHTAIRYQDRKHGIDIVFNYGMFSFQTPHFLWRFILGETDYQLGVTDYQNFATEYEYYGRGVKEQILNLSKEEKNKLFTSLKRNYLPENRVYRYNFFFDNCATRPRNMIENCINGEIKYATSPVAISFRDIIHKYTAKHPWERFGIDLCLGVKADKPISNRAEMFAPEYLYKSFASASIVNITKEKRKLVFSSKELIHQRSIKAPIHNNIPTPLQSFLLVFIITTSLTIYELKNKKNYWIIDLCLFSAAGIAGCIIAFLAVFSVHPTVSPNYLLFVLHPLHILALPFLIYTAKNKRKNWYHIVNLAVLTLFILLWGVIPQRFDFAILPLALSLLIRSASNIILAYKKHK